MRPAIIAIFLISSLATSAAAQNCASLVALNNVRLAGAECRYNPAGTACRAGVPVTVEVNAVWSSTIVPPCPNELTWHFGDGSPEVTTSATSVQHTFGAGNLNLYVRRTTSPHIVDGTSLWMVWGWFSLELDRTTVREGEGPVTATFRRDETTHAGSVYYETGSSPYVAETIELLQFAPGEAAKQVVIPIVNDDVWHGESARGFIRAINPAGYGYPEPEKRELTITDDDATVTYTFAQRGATVNEGGTLQLDVVRGGSLAAATVADVTALGQPKSITFAAGESQRSVQFTMPDDASWRGNFFSVAQVRGQSSPSVVDTIQITVFEDEPIPTITPGSIQVTETNGSQNVAVELTATPAFHGTSFQISAANGTADHGDYAFTQTARQWSGSTMTLHFTLLGDTIAENDETFHLELIAPVVEHLVTVRILDDDRPPFTFELDSPSYAFPEAGGNVTVRRTAGAADAARVTLSFLARSTVAWPDPIAIDFAAGETSKSVFLPTDDAWFTGDREATLELEWNGFKGASADLSVIEDETMPRLSIANASVTEGASGETVYAEVPLTLSGPLGTDLFVRVRAEAGSASHQDYVPPSLPVHFTPGALRAVARIPIRGDDEQEPNETFIVRIESCCANLASIEVDRAVVTILNDDGGSSSSYALEASGSYHESSKWLVAYVTRTDAAAPATVAVRLTADDARRFAPATVRFRAGETREEVRFFIDDGYYSGNAQAQLEVLDGTRIDDRESFLIFEDEGQPVVRVGDVTVPVFTEPRPVVFPITIDPPSWKPIQLQIQTLPSVGNAVFDRIDRIETIPSLASRIGIETRAAFSSRGAADERFQLSASLWPVNAKDYAIKKPTGICTLDRLTTNVTFAPFDPLTPAGTKRTLTLVLTSPAIFGDIALASSAPEVLSVPASVTMTPGSREVAVEVTALTRGNATIAASLPAFFEYANVTASLSVFNVHVPVVEPQRLTIELGETAHIALAAAPPSGVPIVAAIEVVDGSVVFADRKGVAGESFAIYGANIGTTEIVVTFPPEAGGTSVRIPVEVPDTPSRRRGVRH